MRGGRSMLKPPEYYRERLEEEEETFSAYVIMDCEFSPDAVGLYQKMELDWKRQEKERVLREIREALQRLEKGTYAICAQCGDPIDPERLEAKPRTTLCIKCASSRWHTGKWR
jgi:RNA polymerase-binding transcription factor DksA